MGLIRVNGCEFEILNLLGKGKGGYSYLVSDGMNKYVVKKIHHEPCEYYKFNNKIESELNDYNKLYATNIRIPKMLDIDMENEVILKEFIDGDTVYDLVLQDKMKIDYINQVKVICKILYPLNINIDYFPTNFIMKNEQLWYIDYKCNDYMEEWNFENWGIKYWSKTTDLIEYINRNEIKIRFANAIDATVLGKIHTESWKVAYKNIIPNEVLDNINPEKRASYFKKALSEGLEEDAIIYKNDNALGFICFGKCRDNDLDSSFGEVWGIYLLPEFWRQGVGSKLIDFGINELKNKGYTRISLWVLENNKNAIKFYEKQGFKNDGTKKEIVIGMPLNECRYVKVIG